MAYSAASTTKKYNLIKRELKLSSQWFSGLSSLLFTHSQVKTVKKSSFFLAHRLKKKQAEHPYTQIQIRLTLPLPVQGKIVKIRLPKP